MSTMKIPNPLAQFLLQARAQGREGAETLHLVLYLRFSGLWELKALGPPHSSLSLMVPGKGSWDLSAWGWLCSVSTLLSFAPWSQNIGNLT